LDRGLTKGLSSATICCSGALPSRPKLGTTAILLLIAKLLDCRMTLEQLSLPHAINPTIFGDVDEASPTLNFKNQNWWASD